MFWLSLALAEDPCEPVRPRALADDVDRAAEAFAAGGLVEGELALAAVRRDLACLAAPVDPAVLGAVAWLEAEEAALHHDADAAWPWVFLARDLRVDPPPHLQRAHPLQSALAYLPDAPPIGGNGEAFAEPGRTRIVVDGQHLELPRVREGIPHLVQVFDGRDPVVSWWQHGARFPGDRIALRVELPAGKSKEGSAAYWESWLREHPDSRWRGYALDQLDDVRFREALASGGAGLEAYLDGDPRHHRDAALGLLEPMDFARAVLDGSRASLSGFLEAHPDGRYTGEARDALDALDWELATEQDTATGYARYLERQPRGRWAPEAHQRLASRRLAVAAARDDRQALAELTVDHPGTVQGARARALAQGVRIQALVVAGDTNEPIVQEARQLGLRVERAVDAADPGRTTVDDPAGTGRVWSRVAEVDGVTYARGELWLPGSRAPVFTWRASGIDDVSAREALAAGMVDLETWVGAP
ncbi:MAG: hypothetical protein H6734_07035 [Alphaproteobacteria bacterium]|nr:hypothetical protein [Alphaproteobacteria bacterium]